MRRFRTDVRCYRLLPGFGGCGMKPMNFWRLLSILAAFAWSCGDKIEPGHSPTSTGAPVKAQIAEARLGIWPLMFEAVGTVQAETASTIGAKLLGTVTAVRVQEGDRVRTGEVLATIDERQAGAQRQQAEAALAEARRMEQAVRAARDAARAGADLASATYHRFEALFAQESVSRQEFDDVQTRFRQAEAGLVQSEETLKAAIQRVAQFEAALASARVSAADATVKAPFDGIVTAKMVEVGELAAPGRSLLSLEKAGSHRVDIRLPEAYVDTVRLGQKVTVRIGGTPQPAIDGVIDIIAPAADPGSRSFLVKVRLPVTEGMRSGMFARVEIAVGKCRMITVPSSAVIRRGQLTGIFLVTTENVVRFRLIRTGREMGDGKLEVLSGLTDGARFVVNPSPELTDGSRVEAPA